MTAAYGPAAYARYAATLADAKPGITREMVEALRNKIKTEIHGESTTVRIAKFNSFHMGKNAALDAVLALETTAMDGGEER